MELILLLAFGYGIYSMFSSGADQSSLPRSAKELLYISVEKDTAKNDDFTIYKVKGEGLLPNKYAMDLSAALYIYDDETNLPLLSNFTQTDESSNSRVFRRDVNLGYLESGQYFPNMVDLSNVILEGIQHPYKGDRKLDFVLFFYDSNRPVNIKNGRIIAKKENLVHYCSVHKTFSFDEPGYMDEIENIDAAKPLMVEIAMQMAMSDGSLDQSEGDVIKKWIKKEIDLASDSKKENIKKKLNTALESSYKKLSSGENIDLIIDNFSEIASKNIKYQLIEFCLDVLSADGVADEGELQHLEELTAKIGLNFDEVQKMKDKALVKIDTKNIEGGESASDESLLSMKLDLSKDEALIFIKKEYRKWNGRLNTLNSGKERDNAQRMLDALARLRKKYENK